jgi:PA14 domain-containing protein
MTTWNILRTCAVFAASVIALSAVPAEAQVALAHVAGYHAGGGPLGGGHPTAGAYSFTVPEGEDRFLLVVGPDKYDPAIPAKVSSQRATLTSLTYAGKPLVHLSNGNSAQTGHGGAHWWYLPNPPMGTHKIEMIQFRVNNGGENRMAVLAFTGVDLKDPFTHKSPLEFRPKGKVMTYTIKGRAGGMVIDSFHYGRRTHKYPRVMSGKGQRLVWDNCHDYRYVWMGSVKPGADKVEMRWEKVDGGGCHISAMSLNPAKDSPDPAVVEPLKALPKDKLGAEKPGLVAKVYDLSASPPKPSTRRYNYKKPALGTRIRKFDAKMLHTTKVVEQIDLHPNNYRKNPDRLPDEKGVLDSGIRKNFIIEFVGRINIPESGDIMLKLLSVDQAKLWIDGQLVVDNHGHNYNTLKTGVIRLEAGKHELRLVNVEDARNFGVSLGWRLPGGYAHNMPRGRKAPISVVPPSALTHADQHLK